MRIYRNYWTQAEYDFIVDAIDTISPKCFLIYEAMKRHIKIVSSIRAGQERYLSGPFADLWDTYHCGLSKAVRKRLQKMGMKRKLPVVFSTEQADPKAVLLTDDEQNKKSTCGTVSYMPAVFGCYLANMSLNDYKYHDKIRRNNKKLRFIASPERY